MSDITWIDTSPAKQAPVVTKAADTKAQTQVIKPKPQEIKLKYKYSGTCQDCGHAVDTLEIDLNKEGVEIVVVAYCHHCGKQVTTKQVAKL